MYLCIKTCMLTHHIITECNENYRQFLIILSNIKDDAACEIGM